MIVSINNRPSRPRLVTRDTDSTILHYQDTRSPEGPSTSPHSPTTLAWSNEKWLQITQGRPLESFLDSATQYRLETWIQSDDTQLPLTSTSGDASIFVLELKRPAVRLHLVKSLVPLSPPFSTHTFCIITSQPGPPGLIHLPAEEVPLPRIIPSTSRDSPHVRTRPCRSLLHSQWRRKTDSLVPKRRIAQLCR